MGLLMGIDSVRSTLPPAPRGFGVNFGCHAAVSRSVRVSWNRAGVTDLPSAVATLRAEGFECSRDDERFRRVFVHLATLELLAEGRTTRSIGSKEVLVWLPPSIELAADGPHDEVPRRRRAARLVAFRRSSSTR
jgi:hypothetical protein